MVLSRTPPYREYLQLLEITRPNAHGRKLQNMANRFEQRKATRVDEISGSLTRDPAGHVLTCSNEFPARFQERCGQKDTKSKSQLIEAIANQRVRWRASCSTLVARIYELTFFDFALPHPLLSSSSSGPSAGAAGR